MKKLRDFYRLTGSDSDEIINRFNGNPETVKRFVLKFPSDNSFSRLKAFLTVNDTQEAFRAAHTLKGICANLGFTRLYRLASDITELLRSEKSGEAKTLFPKLETEYLHVLESMKLIF